MSANPFDSSILEALTQFDTPTVSNAIESFKVRSKTEGFADPSIRCILPVKRPVIGYACTAKISALQPPSELHNRLRREYYEYLQASPGPRLAVIQDTDRQAVGSFWGEVQGTIFKTLGSTTIITNGGVRDLDELEGLGFSIFASCVMVSHAYVHVEAVACPVEIGGLIIHPGDLLHADKHGVLAIPSEVVPELVAACRKAQWAEEPVLHGCRDLWERGADAGIDELMEWIAEMNRRRQA